MCGGSVLRLKDMRRNLLNGKLVRAHLKVEFGTVHLTTLDISLESYLHGMLQHKT